MAHGLPDFGIYTAKETVFNLDDMADLAVRLGSIVEYDRRGDVIWLDDFESPIMKWEDRGSGLLWEMHLNHTTPKSGAQHLRLRTTPGVNAWVSARASQQFRGSYRIGAEYAFCQLGASASIEIRLDIYTGSRWVFGKIRYNSITDKLYYQNSAGGWPEFADNVFVRSYIFHYNTWKLVIDAQREKYVRALLGNVEYNLSEYALSATDSGLSPRTIVELYLLSGVALATQVDIDNFVLTINEP